ncbi:hypothetical protein J6590_005698 [Homalodisca vitripennis]|nr:hypothetical protein J6590_005698 [Homalodisca vitripennis]
MNSPADVQANFDLLPYFPKDFWVQLAAFQPKVKAQILFNILSKALCSRLSVSTFLIKGNLWHSGRCEAHQTNCALGFVSRVEVAFSLRHDFQINVQIALREASCYN